VLEELRSKFLGRISLTHVDFLIFYWRVEVQLLDRSCFWANYWVEFVVGLIARLKLCWV